MPWPYRPLLDHAVDCLLLRRVGGGYLFVHRELMLHLDLASLPRDRQDSP